MDVGSVRGIANLCYNHLVKQQESGGDEGEQMGPDKLFVKTIAYFEYSVHCLCFKVCLVK